jgi:hypothetical protein
MKRQNISGYARFGDPDWNESCKNQSFWRFVSDTRKFLKSDSSYWKITGKRLFG